MIHLYTIRRHQNNAHKVLCTGRWVLPLDFPEDKFVTIPHNANCPKCLDIAIPKLEAQLAKVMVNRALHADPQG